MVIIDSIFKIRLKEKLKVRKKRCMFNCFLNHVSLSVTEELASPPLNLFLIHCLDFRLTFFFINLKVTTPLYQPRSLAAYFT